MKNNLQIKPINNKDIWDKFILTYNSWSFFQSFLWGEVQKSIKHENERVGLYKNTELIGIAQISLVKAKRGRFFHIRHGPVFKTLKPDDLQAAWKFLLDYLKSQAKIKKVWFIRVSPMIEDNNINRKLLAEFGFISAPVQAMDAENTWVLDIQKDDTQLLQEMRKTTRYLIKQAEKIGVTVETVSNTKHFYSLYKKTCQRQHFVPHQGINEEYEIFNKSKQAFILEAKYNNQVLASAIILFFGHQAIYHHGASITGKIPANYLLQWKSIQLAKQNSRKLYNFWGIVPESHNKRHPWAGLTLFKIGFGGREVKFMHAQDLPLSPFYLFSYTIEMIRKIFRGY